MRPHFVMAQENGGSAPRIQVMPASLANKIAAGEVVARPASALKELLENSIDAGAEHINVVIKQSGRQQIFVRDDGSGMGAEDAERCFARHATSKIRTAEELDQIWTLGFRGEALAAIAAVSQVTLKTRRQQDTQGHLVRIHGGRVLTSEPCATTVGTAIDVRNLFYNVPARRAFLKSPATEYSHITDSFLAQALANPRVAFSLVHGNSEAYRLAPCKGEDEMAVLRDRVGQILGRSYARKLISLGESTRYISLTGLVCRAEHMRRSRKERFLYVNGRFVRSPSLQHAVMSAYEGMVPTKRYPFYVLLLSMDPRHVDVNVHPAKIEVRFDNDRDVYGFVRAVVRKALGTADLVPQFNPDHVATVTSARPGRAERSSAVHAAPAASGRPQSSPGTLSDALYAPAAPQPSPDTERIEAVPEVWQLHSRYICTALRTGLMILDQRAAHERILYEKARSNIQGGLGPSQQLLFTEPTELDARDMELFDELAPLLAASGFTVDKYSGHTVVVRGVPQGLRPGTHQDMLQGVIADYKNNAGHADLSPRDNLARSVARRGAIKAGTSMTPEEMRALIDELFQCKDPYTSPSGRPVLIRISSDELKRRFSKAPA